MKYFGYSNVAGLGVLLLFVGSAPTSLLSQETAPQAGPQTATQQTSSAAPKSDQNCTNLDSATEQLSESLRNLVQVEDLAKLSQELAKEEAAMSSPEMAKLQSLSAELAAKQGDLQKVQEMAASAQDLAASVQDNVQDGASRIVLSSDDGGGWLGVEIGEVTADKAKDLKLPALRGVIIQDIEPDSPAAKAGLKENDVVLRYDDQTVEGTVQFRRMVRETPAGRTIPLAISRDGQIQTINVELADRSAYYQKKMRGKMEDFGKPFVFTTPNFDFNVTTPEIFSMMDARTPILGINAEDLTGQLGTYFGAPDGNGILIREVRADTAAAKAGLKAGDVIIKVDDKSVTSLSELRDQLRGKSDSKSVNLTVLRKGSQLTVPVAIEKPKPLERVQTIHRAQL